uniref:Bromodomain associated domain-containing protein n=1 Tax=Parascaris equorum TaxID=6256 RepID=A0A914RIT8_PAREQ
MGSNRPLDPTEDYARLLVQQATARILENTGFAQSGERALATLSDITRKLLQKMWFEAKMFAEHGSLFVLFF